MAKGKESKACKFGVCKFLDWESDYADGVHFANTREEAEGMALEMDDGGDDRAVVFRCGPVSRTAWTEKMTDWDGTE